MKTKSNAGFSLVELMVVVAIIGILATIAIPNFVRFQNKAKQSNAKSELAGIFTAERAYFAEYNTYVSLLTLAGFTPEGSVGCAGTGAAGTGNRIYNVGFAAGLNAVPVTTTNPCPDVVILTEGRGWYGCNAGGCTKAAPAAGTSTATQFTAGATGTLAAADAWTINELKVLANPTVGL